MADINYETEAETTEAETTDPETTEDEAAQGEAAPLEDIELEVFKESLQGRSKNTITAYLGAFRRLKEALNKDIHDSSQELIIKTVEKLSSNLNTQASLINIGFLVRKGWNLDVKELVKARAVKKQGIIQYTKKTNQSIADDLPTLESFDHHLDYLYDEKKYKEFIVNYLIRHCYVRNQDLLFDIVKRKADATGNKNYFWIARGGKMVYIRRDYKTVDTYGEKITEFTDKRLLTALRSLKGPLIPNPKQVGYYVKKMSFKEKGEGALLKLILNETRAAGDFHKLNEISKLRGTDVCTLTTSYNIQNDGDKNEAVKLVKSGKKKKES